jgi:PD-(D/E)XK nuclease superfamily
VTLRAILSNHFGKMAMLEQLKAADYSDRPCDALTKRIIGAAIEVHRTLGPGLLESAYEACLLFELHEAGLWLPLRFSSRRKGDRRGEIDHKRYRYPRGTITVIS